MLRPTLGDLPSETITAIAAHLPDGDLRSLHIAGKVLSQKSKYAFAKRFFTSVGVLIHPLSFEKLRGLASDPFYSDFIEQITISTHVLREWWAPKDDLCHMDVDDGGFPVRVVEEKEEEYEQRCWSEQHFAEGCAVQDLVNILQRLSKLRAVAVSDFVDNWVQDVTGHRQSKPWGGSQLLSPSGFDNLEECKGPRVWRQGMHRHQVLGIVLAAASQADLASRNIHLDLTLNHGHSNVWSPDSKDWHYSMSSLLRSFSGFIDITQPNSRQLVQSINPSVLSLDYGRSRTSPNPHNPHLGYYPQLRALKLSRMSILYSQLNNFLLARSETLEVVSLSDVYIWNWGTQGLNHPWIPIWQTLCKMPPRLRILSLNKLALVRHGEDLVGNIPGAAIIDLAWRGQEIAFGLTNLLAIYDDASVAFALRFNFTWPWVDLRVANDMVEKLRQGNIGLRPRQ